MFLQELLLIRGVHMAIFRYARDSGPGGQGFKSGPLGVRRHVFWNSSSCLGSGLFPVLKLKKITIIKQRSWEGITTSFLVVQIRYVQKCSSSRKLEVLLLVAVIVLVLGRIVFVVCSIVLLRVSSHSWWENLGVIRRFCRTSYSFQLVNEENT